MTSYYSMIKYNYINIDAEGHIVNDMRVSSIMITSNNGFKTSTQLQ